VKLAVDRVGDRARILSGRKSIEVEGPDKVKIFGGVTNRRLNTVQDTCEFLCAFALPLVLPLIFRLVTVQL